MNEAQSKRYYSAVGEAKLSGVPSHLVEPLALYIAFGIPPGDCLTAILANDLMEAFGRADEGTARGMRNICTFIYSYAPSGCHGSYETVEEYARLIRKHYENAAP